MKNQQLYLLFLMSFFLSITYGQETSGKTYVFLNPELVQNLANYKTALSTADMTNYRYLDKSSIIEFKSGLRISLFSAKKLIDSGVSVDTSRVLKVASNNKEHYVFDVSPDGKYIMQLFTKTKLK